MPENTADLASLWLWPWEAARTFAAAWETVASANSVIAARTPIMIDALHKPLDADHHELGLMVSEKVDAFGRSANTVAKAGMSFQGLAEANARDFGRLSGGNWLSPADWWRIGERNMRLAAMSVTLPGRALAPVHKGATANAQRLRKRAKAGAA